MTGSHAALSRQLGAFGALLRTEFGFSVGHDQAHDALRALDAIGLVRPESVRAALRAVFCGRREEFELFERAFDAFFRTRPPGVKQPPASHRHARPDDARATGRPLASAPPAPNAPQDEADGPLAAARSRSTIEGVEPDGESRYSFHARFSSAAAPAEPPEIPADGDEQMLASARRLIRRIHRGRSRRWAPLENGTRFDARRTLRASLRTAGDPVALRRLGHPLRNPRFVVLIDGSGSMATEIAPMLRFARALAASTRRCSTFVFSTGLREVSREFRRPGRRALRLHDLDDAWGGGTRIGSSLRAFVREHGSRVLSGDTCVLIFSDGLDVDEIDLLEGALHEIRQRSGAIVWLNPHAGRAGFVPAARGMRAALPFVTVFAPAANDADFAALADRL